MIRTHLTTPATAATLLTLTLALTATPATATPAPTPAPVLTALNHSAHPLRTPEPGGDTRDLRPLDQAIGDAEVVGLGEATHGSHDFFALKARVFRHLVEEQGFRTFALETPWSTGRRLDAYVVHGKGTPEQIFKEEFQRDYRWWNNTDYLALVKWMRTYNIHHPHDPVRFLGDDIAWTGPEVYDEVERYVAEHRPELSARLAELYAGLRPTRQTGAYIEEYLATPYEVREERAERTAQALKLIKEKPSGAGYAMAVQNATAIDRTAGQYAFEFERGRPQIAAGMRYRDEAMAANVAWWAAHTGTKVLLSAHDDHIGYVPVDPDSYPKMQGAFLRDRLGDGYVSVGVTFGHGSFMATDAAETAVRRWTVGPPEPGSNEATLDRVRYRNYVLDLRTVRAPAREWLRTARPTRRIGTAYPGEGPSDVALARAHDVLIHLHRVTAARLRAQ
ncbi:erythromycin esterase family protein [Streptomyces niveiscabiei]|uniref:erythromycin esterase family protein n=1 Tax=Streptomyces niveiscabiei TaxID=164115 RepID=UPI0029B7601E|nr:erythromycin esterase family protein [Streptomyces niveiscabiei]MDX3382563.1 erythromycin esterase family protein [Streptomyces niveiscabiei]